MAESSSATVTVLHHHNHMSHSVFTGLLPGEQSRLEKRRRDVLNYQPPKWRSNFPDPVSGQVVELPMVDHTNIIFIGPTGSGKSSLIGSLCRAVHETNDFPPRIEFTLNHPGSDDQQRTLHLLETRGNAKCTIVYQDTRGDQEYDDTEKTVHEFSMRGLFRDGALMRNKSFISREWWLNRRFFWERTLKETPHCVVFVFDGSSDPFLDAESLEFFQEVFQDCKNLEYEPVIVITCLDLIYADALRLGHNFEVEVQHKQDKVLQAFEDLNLTRQSIYFVTNFHKGRRGDARVWSERDRGFDKACKVMVDLSRDLLSVADRFVERKYTRNTSCSLL